MNQAPSRAERSASSRSSGVDRATPLNGVVVRKAIGRIRRMKAETWKWCVSVPNKASQPMVRLAITDSAAIKRPSGPVGRMRSVSVKTASSSRAGERRVLMGDPRRSLLGGADFLVVAQHARMVRDRGRILRRRLDVEGGERGMDAAYLLGIGTERLGEFVDRFLRHLRAGQHCRPLRRRIF